MDFTARTLLVARSQIIDFNNLCLSSNASKSNDIE